MNGLRRRIQDLAKRHGSLRAAAKVLDIDHGYLSRLQDGGKSEPSDAILRKLGLKRVVLYVPRGSYGIAQIAAATGAVRDRVDSRTGAK